MTMIVAPPAVVFIAGDIVFNGPKILDFSGRNVVVLGKLEATGDLVIKVNTLVVLGGLASRDGRIKVTAARDIFSIGRHTAGKSVEMDAGEVLRVCNITDETRARVDVSIARIQALGIGLTRSEDDKINVQVQGFAVPLSVT